MVLVQLVVVLGGVLWVGLHGERFVHDVAEVRLEADVGEPQDGEHLVDRIAEVMQISNRITVMRDGEYVCTFINDENLKEIDLISRMVGRELTDSLYKRKEYTNEITNEVFFEVKNMNKKNAVYDINFQLKKGEVVGLIPMPRS